MQGLETKVNVLTELKAEAVKDCISIFDDFDEIEVKSMPPSIQEAWKAGRELSALLAEIDAA